MESIDDVLKLPISKVSFLILVCPGSIQASSEVYTNFVPFTLKTGSISNIFEPNPTFIKCKWKFLAFLWYFFSNETELFGFIARRKNGIKIRVCFIEEVVKLKLKFKPTGRVYKHIFNDAYRYVIN